MAPRLRVSSLGNRKRGQSLVEFAVALPFLLVILLGLFEAARWFQAYLAVQYAAREATRFAVTGQPTDAYCKVMGMPVTGVPYVPYDYEKCRVDYIKQVAINLAKLGLIVDHSINDVTKPMFLGVYVRGGDGSSSGADTVTDHAGVARGRIEIRVVYNHPVTNPLMAPLLPTIRVIGTSEMINEPWIGGGPDVPDKLVTPLPLDPLDTDDDGWSDVYERDVTGTLPSNIDTDGDGFREGPTWGEEDCEPLNPRVPDPIACEG